MADTKAYLYTEKQWLALRFGAICRMLCPPARDGTIKLARADWNAVQWVLQAYDALVLMCVWAQQCNSSNLTNKESAMTTAKTVMKKLVREISNILNGPLVVSAVFALGVSVMPPQPNLLLIR